MLARTQLLRVQKELYLKLKDCAQHFFGGLTPEMRRYFREYQRDFTAPISLSFHEELVTALESAQIAVCGDYHTLSQAQRTVIRLVREIIPTLRKQKRNITIALELAHPEHNPLLALYLEKKLSEKALLQGLEFEKNWGFPWENYRPLFQFAQLHRIRLVGLSPPPGRRRPTLTERDRFAAKVLRDLHRDDPEGLVFALIGDLHLATRHLPRALREAFEGESAPETLVLHQNNERLYWDLAERGLENRVDVVKLRDGVFCLFNTPPWVKLQSHLKWAELLSEEDGDSGPDWENTEVPSRRWAEALEEVDHVEEVKGLIESIATFLRLRAEGIDKRFTVHGPENFVACLRRLPDWGFHPREQQRIRWAVETFRSQFIPRANYLCLQEPNLNHEARLAAIYLHSALSGFAGVFSEPSHDFYRFVWVEALGFFGSKVINPRRKNRSWSDLTRYLKQASAGSKAEREVAQHCLAHWKREQRHFRSGHRFPLPAAGSPTKGAYLRAYQTAKVLGKAMGAGLYAAVMEGHIDRGLIAELFECDWSRMSPRAAQLLYLKWGARLDRLGYRLGGGHEKRRSKSRR